MTDVQCNLNRNWQHVGNGDGHVDYWGMLREKEKEMGWYEGNSPPIVPKEKLASYVLLNMCIRGTEMVIELRNRNLHGFERTSHTLFLEKDGWWRRWFSKIKNLNYVRRISGWVASNSTTFVRCSDNFATQVQCFHRSSLRFGWSTSFCSIWCTADYHIKSEV